MSEVETGPPELVAVMEYAADTVTAVGVPETVHVDESESPAGNVGVEAHDVTAPPVLVKLCAVIATPRVSERVDGE